MPSPSLSSISADVICGEALGKTPRENRTTIECGSPQFEGTDQHKHVKWTMKGMDKQSLGCFLNKFHKKETKGTLFLNQELQFQFGNLN